MQDYLKVSQGEQLVKSTDTGGYRDPPNNGSDRYLIESCVYRQLSSSTLIKGDRVTPNACSFYKGDRIKLRGSEIVKTLGTFSPSIGGGNGVINTVETTGYFNEDAVPPVMPADRSYNQCLDNLYGQMRGNLDLSVGLAEAGKTYSMIKKATTLAKYVLGFHPKHWAKHWLEYKFGWYPLVMDIYGTAKEVAYRAPKLQRYKARATVLDRITRTTKGVNITTVNATTFSQRTEIGLVYEPSSSTMTNLSRFSSLNPASIIWELTPFSFIFDYVCNVGGALRSLESSLVLTGGVSHGYLTYTAKTRCDVSVTGNGRKAGGMIVSGTREGCLEDKSLSRSLFTTLPKPTVPRFNTDLSSTQLLTVAAVMSNFINMEGDDVPKQRKISNHRLDKQLANMARNPRKWNVSGEYRL